MRRRLLLLGAVLAAVALAAGVTIRSLRPPGAPPPVPPEVKPDPREPDVAAVIRQARDRVLKDPQSGKAWGELGERFLANELEGEASVCFARAERLDPDDPRWPYCQGGTLLNQGNLEAALPYLRRAAQLCDAHDKGNSTPRLMLAETLLRLGKLDEAGGLFRQVLGREPDNFRAHLGLGQLAFSRGDWKASRDHLLRCVGSPFARQKASTLLAPVYQRLGEPAEADKFRERAERLDKDADWPDPYVSEYLHWARKTRGLYRRAENLEAAGRLAEAAAVVQPLTEKYPKEYLPFLTLGKVLARMGKFAPAEQALRRAVELAPEKAQAHYYLSLTLLMGGQEKLRNKDADGARKCFEEAAELARRVLAIKPDYGYAFMSLGLSLKYLGRRADALAALRQAVRCNPELAELHFYLGEMLAEGGRAKEARYHLGQAIEFGPPDAGWRPAAVACLNRLPKDAGRAP